MTSHLGLKSLCLFLPTRAQDLFLYSRNDDNLCTCKHHLARFHYRVAVVMRIERTKELVLCPLGGVPPVSTIRPVVPPMTQRIRGPQDELDDRAHISHTSRAQRRGLRTWLPLANSVLLPRAPDCVYNIQRTSTAYTDFSLESCRSLE